MQEEIGFKGFILVVDDKPEYVRPLELHLKRQGYKYEFATVKTGQECLEFLKTRVPNLILLDYKLPVLGGLEVLREVRKGYPEVSVVMITAYGAMEVAVGALREGANDYLTKPINFDEMELVIRENLERNRLKLVEAWLRRQLEECSFELAKRQQELEATNSRLVLKLQQAGENLSCYAVNTTLSVLGTLWDQLSCLSDWDRLQGHFGQFLSSQAQRVVSSYPVSVGPAIQEVLELLSPALKRQNIELEVNLPELPEVLMKGTYFQWIVLSLMVRAMRVMAGEGRLMLDVQKTDETLHVTITDTGWPASLPDGAMALTALADMGKERRTPADETNRILYIQALLTEFLGGQLRIERVAREAGTKVSLSFPWIPVEGFIEYREGGR
jgi:DNA-binding response OmpR family regulator